jgi:hypothetical protein
MVIVVIPRIIELIEDMNHTKPIETQMTIMTETGDTEIVHNMISSGLMASMKGLNLELHLQRVYSWTLVL